MSSAQSPNLVNVTSAGPVDATGATDVSAAFIAAITAANAKTSIGTPASVYAPAGKYRIAAKLPEFAKAGCLIGDGSGLTTIIIDKSFAGDLFTWSEAWAATFPGPRVTGVRVTADPQTANIQNAFVLYDRNDRVFFDDVEVDGVYGRAFYAGATQNMTQAYMRESHLRSLRFFNCGAPGIPAMELTSNGPPGSDSTNSISIEQLDIYGSLGPGLVIRNASPSGAIRDIQISQARIEGLESGGVQADLVTIGDPNMAGSVNNIQFSQTNLIDPYAGYAALRLTGTSPQTAPYQITFEGSIGGGVPKGQGLRIDAGRASIFQFTAMHTLDTNIVVGPNVGSIDIYGNGSASWTKSIDPTSSVHILNW
jgi:Pectate lyase superfamily protein